MKKLNLILVAVALVSSAVLALTTGPSVKIDNPFPECPPLCDVAHR